MDIKKKNVVRLSSALCLSCCAFKLEATSLAELQNHFSSLLPVPGALGEHLEVIQQGLAYYLAVEERDPWDRFTEAMLGHYPFFNEYTAGIVMLYFPKEDFAATKSQWWMAHCNEFLALLEAAQNVLDIEILSPEQRETLWHSLQGAIAIVQDIRAGYQVVFAREQEILEQRKAQLLSKVPEEFQDVVTYLQTIERCLQYPPSADANEMLENIDACGMYDRQIEFMKWQSKQELIPYLPNEADQDQFLEANSRISDEVTADL
ncbi:MAG: hypothetical protein LBD40_02480 [Puniceicoccales bacterium]|jgi:hypothetical protein|nr:hypothetical protein [Puniceicoccales bacterium]